MSFIYEFAYEHSGRVIETIEANHEDDARQQFATLTGSPDFAAVIATWGAKLAVKVTAERFHDAQLIAVDEAAQRTTIALPGADVREFNAASTWHKPGQLGTLTIRTDGTFVFWAYAEQRLRRVPALDNDPVPEKDYAGRWGWRLDGAAPETYGSDAWPIFTARFFVPGREGRYVQDSTTALTLKVPEEFFELCQSRGRDAEAVLRGFIADLCELENSVALPREDRYSSNGSDEREMARDYFDRAYFPADGE